MKAYEKLGIEKYREAAVRGMDFVIISQLPLPQSGWGQQYDMNMKTVPARSYEPASVMPQYTAWNIMELMKFYTITGDKRYLGGISDAVHWLDNSYLPEGHAPNDRYTHAMFVELVTNRPIYPHVSGTGIEDGKTWINYDPENTMPGYGMWYSIDVDALRKEYNRVNALTPDEARAEYRKRRDTIPAVPTVDPEKIEQILQSQDSRGAWVEDITMRDYFNPWFGESTTFRGISIRTFIRNMQMMMRYVESLNEKYFIKVAMLSCILAYSHTSLPKLTPRSPLLPREGKRPATYY